MVKATCWRAALMGTALALGGCHALFPYATAPADSSTGDRAPADRRGSSLEQLEQLALPDVRPAIGERALDERALEKSVLEKRALDKPYPRPDGAPPPASACLPPGIPNPMQPYGTASMIQCDYSASISHCQAAGHCSQAAGWHLCTPGEFLARGGKTVGPPGVAAWIAACVRDNGTVYSASVAPLTCSGCGSNPVSPAQIWECSGAFQGQVVSEANVGVHTYGMCKRVGTNVAENSGMWIAKFAGDPSIHGVLCCWP